MSASSSERTALEAAVPALAGGDYEITSPRTRLYNCIGWAAGDDEHWWQPGEDFPGGYYWPRDIPHELAMSSFEAAYRRLGYRACPDGELEAGFEKVVVYEKDGVPSHAARQLSDGRWTSKCGGLEDISHAAPETIAGDDGYGAPVLFMRRRIVENRPTAQELNIN